jgi:hypothetical protein
LKPAEAGILLRCIVEAATCIAANAGQMAKVAAAVGVPPPPATYDGGSARFTCHANGAVDAVGVIDVTAVNQSSVGGFWNVPILIAYRTPAASQAQTEQIARTMRQSYQPNARWQAQMSAPRGSNWRRSSNRASNRWPDCDVRRRPRARCSTRRCRALTRA